MMTINDKELLWELASNAEMMRALEKETQRILQDIQMKVIKLPVDATNQGELIIKKARADGALELATALVLRLKSLRTPHKDVVVPIVRQQA